MAKKKISKNTSTNKTTKAPKKKALPTQKLKTKSKPAPKVVAKNIQKAAPQKASPKTLSASGSAQKKLQKGKKSKEKEFSDDLLLSDDEVGAEELPDLSEFEENQTEDMSSDSEDSLEVTISAEPTKTVSDDEVILTDAEGRRLCRVRDCDQAAAVEAYCRFHYLALWKKIQIRRKILMDGKLIRYVEELTSRYPDKFLEMIWKDLRTEKDFLSAIAELEIDESGLDSDYEDDQGYIDEVRGVSSESSISEEEEF